MKGWMKAGVFVGGGVAAVATAVSIGVARWNRATELAVRRLSSGRASERPALGRPLAEPSEVPAPVARYFAFALPHDARRIASARAAWSGTFLTKRGGRPSAFTAVQHFEVDPSGFVWDATINMAPLIPVHVRDSYLDGAGAMTARAAGVLPVVDQHGSPEIAEAALQRYLGEAVWFPTALLPSDALHWTAIDDSTARATLVDRGNSVSVDFHFGRNGEIVGCTAMRQRDVDGRSVLTPWRTRTWDYQPVDGIMVPHSAEAEWVLPDGPLTYWGGKLERLTYETHPSGITHPRSR